MNHLTDNELFKFLSGAQVPAGVEIPALCRMGAKELQTVYNLTPSKAKKLQAIAEVIKRSEYFLGRRTKKKIESSIYAYEHVAFLQHLDVEHFYVILLNRANDVIALKKISEGGVSGTVVDPKLVFNAALMEKASGIILAHNHPSGNTKPSQNDIELTKRLRECGKMLEISVLDHIIVAENCFYSFADEGEI
jgi:DNA repair protein RadC